MRIRAVLPAALLAVSGLLVGAGTTFAGTAEESPQGGGYPAYQCFETVNLDEYCSDSKVRNDAEGSAWILTCPSGVLGSINSKPYLRYPRPEEALSCSGEGSPNSSDYPAYQCFKTVDRVEYCSDKKVKNHDAGNAWIKTCPPGVQGSINGRPYTRDPRPGNASSC
ncbi:hypothetical protein [Streptomyces graminilatus]|uniref:hypothetical protein n=1 Tax=Streptomyces graminilatus TaxID=1464070 RepID=UPI0006E3DEC2|nr:hypothetical protein [Streptomyces graminilatus]